MSEQNNKQSEFVNELNRLGENLGNLLKTMAESEELKSIEREINAGLEQFTKRLNETVGTIKVEQPVQQVKKVAKDAWQTARGPQIVSEVQQGVVETLKKVNEELAKRTKPAQEASSE